MKRTGYVVVQSALVVAGLFGYSLLADAPSHGTETGSLDEHLEPLRPLLGKTWRGELKKSTPEKPLIDIARWERSLNGKAVRVLHSINDGAYGGESIILWDREREQIVYYYFTTAGFYTTGTMKFADRKILSQEKVSGNPDGVTEVRATTELLPNGTLLTKSEHLKDGRWAPAPEVLYQEDQKAEVKFK